MAAKKRSLASFSARAVYSAALWAAQPVLRRKLRRRAVAEPGYGEAVRERFGHYDTPPVAPDPARPLVWLHAVSLGETRAAATLVAQLREAIPGMRLLLTHGTATGRTQGVQLLQGDDIQTWQPWDTPAAVKRFLAHFQPRIGLLMETEVWPNLVAGCVRAGVPLCLVNARMSEKSLRQSRRLGLLAHTAFASLAAVWAQTEDDAVRLTSLGANVRGVMGNFKFDAAPDAQQLALGQAWRASHSKPVVLFASSREGEEAMLLEFLKKKRLMAPVDTARAAPENIASSVQWLVVPRHPQRFDAVAQLFEEAGLRVARRSQWVQGSTPPEADIWLGDSMGEMALYFGMAHAALLGGSFAPLGGQNLIEAAACGCPVFMGPHTFNFAEASELAEVAGAAFRHVDLESAAKAAVQLANEVEQREATSKVALAWGAAHRGAAQRTAVAVAALLEKAATAVGPRA